MQRLNPVAVGEDPIEQHRLDLKMELANVERLNRFVALCREKGDNGSRTLLEEILPKMRRLGVTPDMGFGWEDICGKSGPLVSPAIFDRSVASGSMSSLIASRRSSPLSPSIASGLWLGGAATIETGTNAANA